MKNVGILIMVAMIFLGGCDNGDDARLLSGYGAKIVAHKDEPGEETVKLLETFMSWHTDKAHFVESCDCGGNRIFIDNTVSSTWHYSRMKECDEELRQDMVDEIYQIMLYGEFVCDSCSYSYEQMIFVEEEVCRRYVPYDEMTKMIQRGSRSYKIF